MVLVSVEFVMHHIFSQRIRSKRKIMPFSFFSFFPLANCASTDSDIFCTCDQQTLDGDCALMTARRGRILFAECE